MNEAFWEEVKRAKKMTGAERMSEGLRMFDRECQARRAELHQQYPDATEVEVRQMLRNELAEARREENELWVKHGLLP
jgi:hypothetical protein